MARTGSFGRLPRSVPSLTNTLIAIAREQQQQEDQNIMDAWQKGGSVDGQKVTDAVVLKYWNNRLADISTDDPLYDTYKNTIQQYTYSIAESKKTAAYAQIAAPTAADDQGMSSFYMNWAKKVPKDSEFYRVLLRDAGQFIRSAKAKQDANTRNNTEKQYNSQQDRLEKTNELPGQTALRWLTLLGQEGSQGQGAVLGEQPTGGTKAITDSTNITNVGLPGVDQMVALLGTVAPQSMDGKKGSEALSAPTANAAVLFHDENGKPVTGVDIIASLKAADPGFNGTLNVNYVRGLLDRQRDGLQKRIDLAKKTGHVSDMVSLTKEQAKVNEYGREVAAWPVAQEYSDLHAKLQAAITDSTLLPDAKVAAITALRAQIGALAGDPRIAEDGHMQSQLRGEANGTVGTLSLAEDLQGFSDGYKNPTGNTDVEYINSQLELYDTQKKDVASGKSVYTQGDYTKDPTTGNVVFVPSTQGASVGAATMDQINNLPGAGKPVPVMVPNGDGGGATPMYVVPAPIRATATDQFGNTVAAANNLPVGGYIRYPVNGVMTTLYSIDRNGTTTWSSDPPWDASKVKTSMNGGVMTIDLSAVVPQNIASYANKDFGTGFRVEGATTNADGTAGTAGHLVFDPKAAAMWTNPPRQYAGYDPYTDSFSASLAAVRNTPDGQNLLQQWTGDPRFNAILDQNAHLSAGQTLDPATGIWTGGDANAYQQSINQMHNEMDWAKTGQPFGQNTSLTDSWWKDTTMTKMTGAPAGTVAGPNGVATPMVPTPGPLPSTVAQTDPGSKMAALGAVFGKGGNILPGKTADDNALPFIKLGTGITVPGVPAPSPMPSPVPSVEPTPTVTPNVPAATPMNTYQQQSTTTGSYGQNSGSATGGSYGQNHGPTKA